MPRISTWVVVTVVLVAATAVTAGNNEIGALVGFRLGGEVNSSTSSEKLSFEENVAFGLIYTRVLSPATEFEFIWSRLLFANRNSSV